MNISTISEECTTKEDQTDCKEPWLKCRYITAAVGFFIIFFINAYRINISVTIVDMVNNSALLEQTKTTSISCPGLLPNATKEKNSSEREYYTKTGEFDWSPKIQGYILGSYYLTYMLAQIPYGRVVERYGCKWPLFWGTIIAALGTLAIPLASKLHVYALIAIQLLRGLGQAVSQPGGSVLIVNWLPKLERGPIYSFMQSGTALGACLGSILSGLLCKWKFLGGWPSSFYAFGIAGLVLSACIVGFIHESPSVHPKISQAELQYIVSNQEAILPKRRPEIPWGKILRSVPVYAFVVGLFGQLWAMSQFLIVNATFLRTILHYPIKENGFLSAIPFLFMFLSALISSSLSSFATTRKYASVDQVRKFWNILSSLGFSSCLLGVCLVGCDRHWNTVFSVLSVSFMGFGMSGCWIVSADMSPTFAASLNGIGCTFGCLPTFIVPLIVGYLTNEMQTIEQWNKVFYISIAVVITCGIVFQVFGSADVQPWNFAEKIPKTEMVEITHL